MCPTGPSLCDRIFFMTEQTDLIDDLGALLAALQVPISLHATGLAQVGPIFDRVHTRLHGFGWSTREDYAEALRTKLRSSSLDEGGVESHETFCKLIGPEERDKLRRKASNEEGRQGIERRKSWPR